MPNQLSRDNLAEHRTKANTFIRKAHKYIAKDPDISKICSFYAAYHAMRYAILSDPIFDLTDEEIYQQTYVRGIYRDSKHNSHHSAAPKSGRGIGQNQIVSILYKKWFQRYEELHKTSVHVRYVVDDDQDEQLLETRDAYDAACKIVNEALEGKICWEMQQRR